MGKKQQQEKLHITISIDFEQTVPLINTPILPGTFLILHQGHPVCDFIAYSSENHGELFFIQVSKSSYMAHNSKVTNLGDTIQVNGNKSILEHYMNLCLTEDGKKRFPKVNNQDIRTSTRNFPLVSIMCTLQHQIQ